MKGGVKQNREVVNDILSRTEWEEGEDGLDFVDPAYYDFVESQVDTTQNERQAMIDVGIDVNGAIMRYRREYSHIDGKSVSNFSLVNGGLRQDNVHPHIQPIVDGLDRIFNHPLCPRFGITTILFRGGNMDFEYDQVVEKREPLQKSFISTTKTINNLFTIIPNTIQLEDRSFKEIPIFINILFVDPGIPYLDLYNEEEGVRDIDRMQDEILLPRGLTYEYAGRSTYTTTDEYTGEGVVNIVRIFYVHR